MTEHHVRVVGGPVTSADQVDLIHTAIETVAGRQISTTLLEWEESTGELTINLWLDAEDTATAEATAKAITRIARNGVTA